MLWILFYLPVEKVVTVFCPFWVGCQIPAEKEISWEDCPIIHDKHLLPVYSYGPGEQATHFQVRTTTHSKKWATFPSTNQLLMLPIYPKVPTMVHSFHIPLYLMVRLEGSSPLIACISAPFAQHWHTTWCYSWCPPCTRSILDSRPMRKKVPQTAAYLYTFRHGSC